MLKNYSAILFVTLLMAFPPKSLLAQKHCNLELTFTSPANGAIIPYGQIATIVCNIRNLGPDDIELTDTITHAWTDIPIARKIWANIPVGGSYKDTIAYVNNTEIADDTFSGCRNISVAQNTSFVDTVQSNDSACIQFILKGSGTVVVNELAYERSIKIYPNPATRNLNIQFDLLGSNKATAEVYTVLGQNVIKRVINQKSFSIDISNLNKGIYFIAIRREDGGSTTKKFQKE